MMSEFNTNECTPLDLLEEAFDAAEDMETSEEKDIGEACGHKRALEEGIVDEECEEAEQGAKRRRIEDETAAAMENDPFAAAPEQKSSDAVAPGGTDEGSNDIAMANGASMDVLMSQQSTGGSTSSAEEATGAKSSEEAIGAEDPAIGAAVYTEMAGAQQGDEKKGKKEKKDKKEKKERKEKREAKADRKEKKAEKKEKKEKRAAAAAVVAFAPPQHGAILLPPAVMAPFPGFATDQNGIPLPPGMMAPPHHLLPAPPGMPGTLPPPPPMMMPGAIPHPPPQQPMMPGATPHPAA